MRTIDHFIGGAAYASGERQGDVFDPNQGEVQAQVALGTAADLARAMDAARAAQPAWAATNPQRRVRVLMKFLDLVQNEYDELAEMLAREHGKTIVMVTHDPKAATYAHHVLFLADGRIVADSRRLETALPTAPGPSVGAGPAQGTIVSRPAPPG